MNMVVPLMESANDLKGTVTDGRLLSVFSSSGNIFAMGVIVKAGKDMFCVFVPGMESAIDTYFGFLRERPLLSQSKLRSGSSDRLPVKSPTSGFRKANPLVFSSQRGNGNEKRGERHLFGFS